MLTRYHYCQQIMLYISVILFCIAFTTTSALSTSKPDAGYQYSDDAKINVIETNSYKFDPSAKINRRFELNITLTPHNPDCYNESWPALLINSQFPAPTLHAVKNDVVQMVVRNDSPGNNQSSSIHFHGIRQYYTSFADGVADITQVGIAPGQNQEYIQTFQILNQSGTFYYHAHIGVQDDSIVGPFIIYDDEASLIAATSTPCTAITDGSYTYDEERILLWSEYWHQSAYDRNNYYLGTSFLTDGGDGGPDSVLLNGRTVYDSNIIAFDIGECKGFSTIDVEANKLYRFRFIGALTFRVLGIIIENHNMTLIEIDGGLVEPYPLDYLEIGPGQRMSVLVKTGDYPVGSLFPISTNFRWRFNIGAGYTNNGYGYLRYVGYNSSTKTTTPLAEPILEKPLLSSLPTNVYPLVETPGWILNNVRPLVQESSASIILGATASRTIKIAMQEVTEADNTTRFRNNGRAHYPWGSPTASLLEQIVTGALGPVGDLDPVDGFSVNHQTYPLGFGEIIDFVFQNVKLPSGICVIHPWHTHGHSHYLIAEGAGDYVHETDKDIRNFATPLHKDVSMTYPNIVNGTINCGWTKVRIYTDNPGVWPIHCHITAHMLQGKIFVIEVAPELIEFPFTPTSSSSYDLSSSSDYPSAGGNYSEGDSSVDYSDPQN